MSIESRILEDLKNGILLTQATALDRYCTSRLGARIKDIRDKGVDVKTEMITVTCRDGHRARIARYYI